MQIFYIYRIFAFFLHKNVIPQKKTNFASKNSINYKSKFKKRYGLLTLDIYTAFEHINVVECINNLSYCDRSSHDCKGCNFWNEFRIDIHEMLVEKTHAQIIK
jgi:hypothetical protein